MKNALLALTLLSSFSVFAADTTLICNDQNSHAVYKLTITEDLKRLQFVTLVGDSSVLSAGSKSLKYQEGESSEDSALFAGKLNNALNVAIHLDLKRATSLRKYEIVEVQLQYQAERNANLALFTEFLCSKN